MHLSKLAIPTALVAILAFPVASNAALITPGSAARSNWGDMARTSFKLKTVRGKCTSSTVKSRFHSSVKRSYGRLAKGGTAGAATTDPCAAGTTPGTGGNLVVTPDPAGAGPLVVAEIFGQDGGSSNPNQGGQPPNPGTPPGHTNGPAASGPGTPNNQPLGPPSNAPPVEFEDILPPGISDPLELLLSGTGSACVPGITASCPPGTPQPPAPPTGGGLPGNPFIPESLAGQGPMNGTNPDFGQDPLASREPAANVPEPASLALLGLGLAAIGYQRRKRTAIRTG